MWYSREFRLGTTFSLNNLFRSSFISGCIEAVYSPTNCVWDSRESSLGTTYSLNSNHPCIIISFYNFFLFCFILFLIPFISLTLCGSIEDVYSATRCVWYSREFSLSTIFFLNNLFRSSFISGCIEAVYSPTRCVWYSREFSLGTTISSNNLFRSSFISLHVPRGGCIEAVYSPTSCVWDSRESSLGTTFYLNSNHPV